ncbi:MAG: cytochrome c oxidase accessory protein CcoG [Bdellovibrionia bacterium]
MSDLDVGKLTSVDAHGDRLYIIPAEVKGFFRKHRNWTQAILILIFLVLPWTKVGGHQTILLDIPNREFNIFGVLFRAHDAPLMFFLIAGGALTLAFVTSVWGRVWCGWACPQTVFIDGVYRRIEQLIEGNYLQRKALRSAPMSTNKLVKLVSKWFLFIAVSSIIAHSFVAYFVGAENLLDIIQGSPANNWTLFIIVSFFTAIFIFDFVWFREQFCVIMCPYGRIQGLLYDNKTMTVAYDQKRGEPRRGTVDAKDQKQGDCVSCGKCVAACPTGIDIRNGLQIECIACTACIDACDEIMEKVKKPKGLIRYATLDGSKIDLKKPRSLLYLLAIVACAVGLTYNLVGREPSHVALMRAKGVPYSTTKLADGTEKILNHFKLHITNQAKVDQKYSVDLPQELKDQGLELIIPQNPLTLTPGVFHEWHFFVRAPKELFANSNQVKSHVIIADPDNAQNFSVKREFIILGPHAQ